jgi:hypothetical protein
VLTFDEGFGIISLAPLRTAGAREKNKKVVDKLKTA